MFVFFFNWLGFSNKKRSLLQENKQQEASKQLFQVFILEQILTPSGSLIDIDGDGIPDTVTDGLAEDIDLLDNAVTDLPEKDHFASPEVFTLVNDTVNDETITLSWIDGDDLENSSVYDSLVESTFEFETSRNAEITLDNSSINSQIVPLQEPMHGEPTTDIVFDDNVADLDSLKNDGNLNQEFELLSFIDDRQTLEYTPELEENSHFANSSENIDIASEDVSKALDIDEVSTANEHWKITVQSADSYGLVEGHSLKETVFETDIFSTNDSNLISGHAGGEPLNINLDATVNQDSEITYQSVDSHTFKEVTSIVDSHSTNDNNLISYNSSKDVLDRTNNHLTIDNTGSESLDINDNITVLQQPEIAGNSIGSDNSKEITLTAESTSPITNDLVGDNDDITEITLNNDLNLNPLIKSGYFIVEETGKVTVDFQFDGGKYQFELAIFSLDGMEDLEPGSENFIREAAYRALSNSDLGHVVISDAIQGARFSGILGTSDLEDYNSGTYKAPIAVSMRPGDTFGFMLVPNGTTQQVFENPNADGALRPLFSVSTANPNEASHTAQLADVFGNGTTFVMEDLRVDTGSDRDYNDVIFRVEGAKGYAAKLDNVIAPGNEWRYSELGQRILTYVSEYDNPDKEALGNPTYPGLPTPEIPIPTVSPTVVDQGGNGFSDLTGVSNPTVEPNQGGALPNTPTLIETSATGDLIDQVSSTDSTDFYQVSSTQLVDTEISVLSGNTSLSILTPEGELLSQQVLEQGSHSLTLPTDISGEVLLKFENQGGSDATYMLRGFESQAKEPFNIDVEFGEGLSASQKQIIQAAAKSIESLIGQGLPSAIVDGKIIDDVNFKISVDNLDGSGGTLAQTKIDFMRYGTLLPAQSLTQFDVFDITQLETEGQLFSVVQHEILHGLGFGNLWEAKGLVDYAGTDFARYTGENAVSAFQELGGLTDFISLETEGKGSADLHWHEMLFQNELMTRDLGFQTGEDGKIFSPISIVTLAALADLGYQVNRNRATPNWGLLGTPPIKEEDISEETRQALEQLIAESKAQNPDSEIPIIIPAVDPKTISPEIWAHAERFDINGEYYGWELVTVGNWRNGHTIWNYVRDRMTHPSKLDNRSPMAKANDKRYWQFIVDQNRAFGVEVPELIWEGMKIWLPDWDENYEAEQEAERKRREEELNKKLEEEKKERERLEEIYRQRGSGGLESWLAKPLPDFGDKAPFETSVRDVVGSLVPDDYFRFNLSRPGYVTIYLEDLLADADLYLYDSRNRLIGKAERSGVTDEKIIVNLPPGSYIVRVHSANGLATDYNLKVRFDGLPSRTQIGSGSGNTGGKKPRGATFADPRIERIFKQAVEEFAAPERRKAQSQVDRLKSERDRLEREKKTLIESKSAELRGKVHGMLDQVKRDQQENVNGIANKIKGGIDNVANGAINLINGLIPDRVFKIPVVGGWIKDRFNEAKGAIEGAINGARNWLKAKVDEVKNTINNAISWFIDRVKDAYFTAGEANIAIEGIAKEFRGMIENAISVLNGLIGTFKGKITGPLEFTRNIGVGEWNLYDNAIVGLVNNLTNGVQDAIRNTGRFLMDRVTDVEKGVQFVIGEIGNLLGDETGRIYNDYQNKIRAIDNQIETVTNETDQRIRAKEAEYKNQLQSFLNQLGSDGKKILDTILNFANSPAGQLSIEVIKVALGFVPVVGQAIDVIDTVNALWKIIVDGKRDPETIVELLGSLAGWFPGFGDAIKSVTKIVFKGPIGALLKQFSPEVTKQVAKVFKEAKWKEILLDVVEGIGEVWRKFDSTMDSTAGWILDLMPGLKPALAGVGEIIVKLSDESPKVGDSLDDISKQIGKKVDDASEDIAKEDKAVADKQAVRASITDRKLDYLFNKDIKLDDHNSPRAAQNAQQLQRLGIYDDPEGRTIVKTHLEQVVPQENNVFERFVNSYNVDTEVRESLLTGPSGKFAKVQSSWEVMADGTRRFLSAQIFGG